MASSPSTRFAFGWAISLNESKINRSFAVCAHNVGDYSDARLALRQDFRQLCF